MALLVEGRVSPEHAERDYGVTLRPGEEAVDDEATRLQRTSR